MSVLDPLRTVYDVAKNCPIEMALTDALALYVEYGIDVEFKSNGQLYVITRSPAARCIEILKECKCADLSEAAGEQS